MSYTGLTLGSCANTNSYRFMGVGMYQSIVLALMQIVVYAISEKTAEGAWLVAPISLSTSGISGRAIGSYQ